MTTRPDATARVLYSGDIISKALHQLATCPDPTLRNRWRIALEWGRDVACDASPEAAAVWRAHQ